MGAWTVFVQPFRLSCGSKTENMRIDQNDRGEMNGNDNAADEGSGAGEGGAGNSPGICLTGLRRLSRGGVFASYLAEDVEPWGEAVDGGCCWMNWPG